MPPTRTVFPVYYPNAPSLRAPAVAGAPPPPPPSPAPSPLPAPALSKANPSAGPMLSTAILAVCAALLCIGVVIVYSAGQSLREPVDPLDPTQLVNSQSLRQFLFAPLALLIAAMVSRVDYHRAHAARRLVFWPALWLWVLTVVGLLLVFVPGIGVEVNGARRWIRLAPGVGLQPSELAKLALPLLLAGLLGKGLIDIRRFWMGLLPLCLIVGLTCGLVGKEDLGTAILLAAVAGSVFILGGARLWHLALLAGPALAAVGALVIIEPYRVTRITSFANIWADPQGAGYHPIQSLITIAEGGVWGTGLGGSVQKLGYLPESQTDFIFSVITSELGLIGAGLVISLFILLLWLGRNAFRGAPDQTGRLVAAGVTLTICLQAIINIAVVTVSAPTKGISLPFVSAGGTGVLVLACGAGLLANVARQRRWNL